MTGAKFYYTEVDPELITLQKGNNAGIRLLFGQSMGILFRHVTVIDTGKLPVVTQNKESENIKPSCYLTFKVDTNE